MAASGLLIITLRSKPAQKRSGRPTRTTADASLSARAAPRRARRSSPRTGHWLCHHPSRRWPSFLRAHRRGLRFSRAHDTASGACARRLVRRVCSFGAAPANRGGRVRRQRPFGVLRVRVGTDPPTVFVIGGDGSSGSTESSTANDGAPPIDSPAAEDATPSDAASDALDAGATRSTRATPATPRPASSSRRVRSIPPRLAVSSAPMASARRRRSMEGSAARSRRG